MAELAASSPKRSRREIKRGEDGAAVKGSVPLQGTKKLWEPQVSRGSASAKQKSKYMQTWRNWQTRWIQVPVKAISCGFDSHRLHHIITLILIQSQSDDFFCRKPLIYKALRHFITKKTTNTNYIFKHRLSYFLPFYAIILF